MTRPPHSTIVRWLIALLPCLCMVLFATTASMQQGPIAILTAPVDGQNLWPELTFQWTAVGDAECYYLYVGTSPGAKDIVNTGEIQTTSRTVASLPVGVPLYARLFTKRAGVWAYRDSTFTAQPQIATLTAPTDGQIWPGLTFQWTPIAGAERYYLYVGTSPGAKDVVDTGEIQTTSKTVTSLPEGITLYARLFTKRSGAWAYRDSTFTAQPLATLTAPVTGQSLWSGLTFQWTAVAGAECYYLYVGTSPGAKDIVNTGEIQTTSRTVASLPAGVPLYARLFTKRAGVWAYRDSTFTAQPQIATLTAPTDGQIWPALTFQWTPIAGAERYYLYVGTSPGAKDVVNTGEIQTTSKTVTSLPEGITLYARLFTKRSGAWAYRDSTFTAQPLVPTLTTPGDGQSDVPVNVSFSWSSVPNVQAYYLYVGTTPGAKNIVNTGETLNTAYESQGLPPETTLYARMFARVGGVWRYRDSSFVTQRVVSHFTYPANDAPSVPLPVAFQWTAVPNVQAYKLYVGTGTGLSDVLSTGETSQTSWTATLPEASTMHARLWTKVANVWQFVDIKFGTQAVVARLSYPLTGLTVSTDVTFTWNAVAGAQGYTLAVGTTLGGSNVLQTPEQTTTSVPATNLPQGVLLHARLGTRHDGVWRYSDSTFTTQVTTAVLTAPADASTGVPTSTVFQWTPVPDAQLYRLQLGSSIGALNIFDSGDTTQTDMAATLPDSSTVSARLWTKVDGTWRYVDSTFSTVALRARFIHPVVGAVGVDPEQPLQWTAAVNADAYTLQIGSTWGANDLLDTGEIQATSYQPQGLPIDQTLYARIRTRAGSVSRFDDTMFTLDSAVLPSQIVEPADGQSGFGTGQPFRWQTVAMASGYRLQIGSSPGTSNLHDSGEIFVTRRFVRNLPVGVTLYGQLQTHVGNAWISTDFSFSVGSTAPSNATTVDTARWATAEIRQMADAQNNSMPWSALGRNLNPSQLGKATPGDYVQALLTTLAQINSGAQSRQSDIAFTPGTTENHVLVEFQRPDTGTWMLLDPTFALTVNRTLDGASATAAEVSAATLGQSWSDVSYEFLSAAGDAYVSDHYIDYPLLYLNLVAGGVPPANPPSPAPYLLEVSTPVSMPDTYVLGCEGQAQTPAVIDGQLVTVLCGGPGSTSGAVHASSIVVPSGSFFRVFTLRRFVF